jgi:ABC-type branched-subunit amino acid transport system substrate-binding protein
VPQCHPTCVGRAVPRWAEPVQRETAPAQETRSCKDEAPHYESLADSVRSAAPEARLALQRQDPIGTLTLAVLGDLDFPSQVGRYRFLAPLGEGGAAVVFLAVVDGKAGFSKLFVVKVLRPALAREPELVTLFLDEARIAARMSHPNVVQTNEVGEEGGVYFLAMEYLDGQSLAALRERARQRFERVPFDLHVRVLIDALAGLDYAHSLCDFEGRPLHIVHRDVSPQNIFLTYDGRILLLDFGIATIADRTVKTETGLLRGKLAYMAPEQIAGVAVDARADIYAMGILLWEAATGTRLRPQAYDAQTLHRAQTQEAPSPRTVDPAVPAAIESICAKALARDPDRRYPTAGALRADLEAYLDSVTHKAMARDVGAHVATVFASERTDMRRRIEKQLAAPSGSIALTPQAATPMDPARKEQAVTQVDVPDRAAPTRGRGRSPAMLVFAVLALAAILSFAAVRTGRGKADAAPATSAAATATPAPAAPTCTTSRECVERAGKDHFCRRSDHTCASLVSVDCPRVVGDAANDDAIFVGTLLRMSDKPDAHSSLGASPDHQRGIELAFREVSESVVGLPGGAGGRPRPLVLVECNQLVDPVRAASHLTDDVGVPAIIGPATSGVALKVAQNVTIPRGVLLISPSATSPVLTTLRDDGLFFRTVPSDTFQGRVLARIVPAFAHDPRRPLRIALVDKGDAHGTGLRDVLLSSIRFNDATLADNQAKGAFFLRDYPNTDDEPAFDFSPIVSDLLGFHPDLLVALGTSEVDRLVAALERGWRDRWPSGPRPSYVFSDGVSVPALLDTIDTLDRGTDTSVRKRIRGTQQRSSGTATYDAFRLRFSAAFPANSSDTGAANGYDAAYAVIYALASIADGAPTGAKVAAGLARLVPPGAKVNVGPSGINAALQALAHGGKIDLNGASGPLDFESATGDVAGDIDVFCVSLDRAKKPAFASSGQYFSATSERMVGVFNAPGNPCAY